MTTDDAAAILATLQTYGPIAMFFEAALPVQIICLALVKFAAVTAFMVIIRMILRTPKSMVIRVFGYIGLSLGLLGTLYIGLTILTAMQTVNEMRLVMILPALLEAATVLGMGLVVWLIAFAGNAGARKST